VFARALLAFLALPGVVAFGVPLTVIVLSGQTRILQPWGLALLVAGIVGLLWCVRDFYVAGRGTLAPWAPPERLVIVGLYRFSRNPMYVSVMLILLGWAASFRSQGLLIYALCVGAAFHLRVIWNEEPYLARTHGSQWSDYKAHVPRWFRLWPATSAR
jgi:protein-S-isoprenylcysteine O-methyltransferase Ste14